MGAHRGRVGVDEARLTPAVPAHESEREREREKRERQKKERAKERKRGRGREGGSVTELGATERGVIERGGPPSSTDRICPALGTSHRSTRPSPGAARAPPARRVVSTRSAQRQRNVSRKSAQRQQKASSWSAGGQQKGQCTSAGVCMHACTPTPTRARAVRNKIAAHSRSACFV